MITNEQRLELIQKIKKRKSLITFEYQGYIEYIHIIKNKVCNIDIKETEVNIFEWATVDNLCIEENYYQKEEILRIMANESLKMYKIFKKYGLESAVYRELKELKNITSYMKNTDSV